MFGTDATYLYSQRFEWAYLPESTAIDSPPVPTVPPHFTNTAIRAVETEHDRSAAGTPPTQTMSTNPLSDAVEPDLQTVFDVLTNKQCRTVLRSLDSPMSAREIAATCRLPRSTVYRKLEQMVDAGLLDKVDSTRDATQYCLGFDEVVVSYESKGLDVSVNTEPRSASDQLSELWTDV